jgi:uncharacterized protein (DUF1778 family)
MGRPKKAAELHRTHRLHIALTEGEYRTLTAAAAAESLTIADIMRRASMASARKILAGGGQ